MIPTSLYGIDSKKCDDFFLSLPRLLEGSNINDPTYEKMLYATLELDGYEQIKKINTYIGFEEHEWSDEINQEIKEAFEFAKNSSFPEQSSLSDYIYA